MKQFFADIIEFISALWDVLKAIPACIPALFKCIYIILNGCFEMVAGIYIVLGSFLLYCAFILSPFIAIILVFKWLF